MVKSSNNNGKVKTCPVERCRAKGGPANCRYHAGVMLGYADKVMALPVSERVGSVELAEFKDYGEKMVKWYKNNKKRAVKNDEPVYYDGTPVSCDKDVKRLYDAIQGMLSDGGSAFKELTGVRSADSVDRLGEGEDEPFGDLGHHELHSTWVNPTRRKNANGEYEYYFRESTDFDPYDTNSYDTSGGVYKSVLRLCDDAETLYHVISDLNEKREKDKKFYTDLHDNKDYVYLMGYGYGMPKSELEKLYRYNTQTSNKNEHDKMWDNDYRTSSGLFTSYGSWYGMNKTGLSLGVPAETERWMFDELVRRQLIAKEAVNAYYDACNVAIANGDNPDSVKLPVDENGDPIELDDEKRNRKIKEVWDEEMKNVPDWNQSGWGRGKWGERSWKEWHKEEINENVIDYPNMIDDIRGRNSVESNEPLNKRSLLGEQKTGIPAQHIYSCVPKSEKPFDFDNLNKGELYQYDLANDAYYTPYIDIQDNLYKNMRCSLVFEGYKKIPVSTYANHDIEYLVEKRLKGEEIPDTEDRKVAVFTPFSAYTDQLLATQGAINDQHFVKMRPIYLDAEQVKEFIR